MKATVLAVLIAAMSTNLLASTDRGNEKENSQAIIRNTGKKAVYEIVYQSSHKGSVTVNILDGNGNVIMADYIRNERNGFMRPYNFSSLAEGNYQIEINDYNGKVVLPLSHVVAKAAPAKVKIEEMEAKKFQLVLTGQAAEGLEVNILDGSNRIVYSDYVTAQGSFSKIYNLSKIKAESFTFEVKSQNKVIRTERF